METQVPKSVSAYVTSFFDTPSIIPTIPVTNTGSKEHWLIKINDSGVVVKSILIEQQPTASDMGSKKIICTSDNINSYVYIGSFNVYAGPTTTYTIYRVIKDSTIDTLITKTNGIFDVDELNKKLYFANGSPSNYKISVLDLNTLIITDLSTTIYSTISEMKINPQANNLLVAGVTSVNATPTSVLDIYAKDNLNIWQYVKSLTYANVGDLIEEIITNKEGTIAYAVNPTLPSLIMLELFGTYNVKSYDLTGYIPNSVQLKGTVLYVADSLTTSILKFNASNLSFISPIVNTKVIPHKLAFSAYEDELFITPEIAMAGDYRIDILETIPTIDKSFDTSPYNIGLNGLSPIGVYTEFSETNISPTTPIPDESLRHLNEAVCIIASKVFSSCKDKQCKYVQTENLIGDAPYTFIDVRFGKITLSDSPEINYIEDGKYLSRVQFTCQMPYTLKYKANDTISEISGNVVLNKYDALMYIPQSKNKNIDNYNLILEDYTTILNIPKVVNNTFEFYVGIYLIIKIVENVQLFMPSFGYCPEPIDYIPYNEDPEKTICESFMEDTSFPVDTK